MKRTNTGEVIKQARLRMGLTQAAVSKNLCDRSVISRIENGDLSVTIDLLTEVCERVGISLFQVMAPFMRSRQDLDSLRRARSFLAAGKAHEAMQIASTSWWSLLEVGGLETAHASLELLLTLESNIELAEILEPILNTAIYHHIANQGWHEAFEMAIALQRVYGNAESYERVTNVGRSMLTFSPEPKTRARILLGMGTAQFRLHHPSDGIELYTEASNIAIQYKNRELLAQSKHGSSACHLANKSYQEALKNAKDSVDLYTDIQGLWSANQNLALAYIGVGEMFKGDDLLERCENYWMTLRNPKLILSVIEDRFLLALSLNEKGLAEEHYQKAMRISNEFKVLLPSQFAQNSLDQ